MVCSCPKHHVRGLLGSRSFQNVWPTWEERGLLDAWRWFRERKSKGIGPHGWISGVKNPTPEQFREAFPIAPTDWTRLANPPANGVQLTFIGHASTLVQMEGVTFLTDPIISERCSPISWLGPKRVVPPAVDLFDKRAPKIDFVVISHSHYDHLDTPTVRAFRDRFRDSVTWYVPLGLKAWFSSLGVTNVVELDWWEEAVHPRRAAHEGASASAPAAASQPPPAGAALPPSSGVRVVCTPCQHWSARTPFDRNKTLWSSWAVVGGHRRFWFGGDTGYCSVFKEIGDRLGPFDLSAIPVAAYEPRWFHRPAHLDPADAVKVHVDVRSKRSVGVHCCTWSLTDEPLDEPPKLLARAGKRMRNLLAEEVKRAGLHPASFVTMQHGTMMQTTDGATARVEKEAAAAAEEEAEASETVAVRADMHGHVGNGNAVAPEQRASA